MPKRFTEYISGGRKVERAAKKSYCGGRSASLQANWQRKNIILIEKECEMLTGVKGEASKAD